MTRETLWTVPHLPEGMDTLWTAQDKWTNSKSCPQAANPLLGQVIKRTSDLPTAAWITARLDAAVTHTDHSDNGDEVVYFFRRQENGKRLDEFGEPKSENSLTNYTKKIPVDRRGKTQRQPRTLTIRSSSSPLPPTSLERTTLIETDHPLTRIIDSPSCCEQSDLFIRATGGQFIRAP